MRVHSIESSFCWAPKTRHNRNKKDEIALALFANKMNPKITIRFSVCLPIKGNKRLCLFLDLFAENVWHNRRYRQIEIKSYHISRFSIKSKVLVHFDLTFFGSIRDFYFHLSVNKWKVLSWLWDSFYPRTKQEQFLPFRSNYVSFWAPNKRWIRCCVTLRRIFHGLVPCMTPV